MITDEELLACNQRGIIPGPNESAEEFEQRVSQSTHLVSILKTKLGNTLPFDREDLVPVDSLKSAYKLSQSYYDIAPDWMPIFFSNYKLSPWQGGCMWSFQTEEKGAPCALLQLRKKLQNSQHYLKIYDRDEIIAHEMAHVGRMAFQEAQFEEMIAYRSSPSKFRRWFGPIVQSASESFTFMISLVLVILLNFLFLIWDLEDLYQMSLWLFLIPFCLVSYALIRLGIRQNTFIKCLNHLKVVFRDDAMANGIIYRLTDREIIKFSKTIPENILDYFNKNKESSLRFRLLALYCTIKRF